MERRMNECMDDWQMAMRTTRGNMVSTSANRRLGGVAATETDGERFSNKMTFKLHREQVASMWQCV